jgi:prophage tail gpP-like protein
MQLKNVTLQDVAMILCEPFGIQVWTELSLGAPLPSWNVLPGETVFENLEKLARFNAVLLTTDPDGDLLIARASKLMVPTVLEHGVNILEMRAAYSMRKRGNIYVVTASSIWPGNELALTATAPDSGVLRHRPIVVIAEDKVDVDKWAERVAWEASVRAGRGTEIEVTVQGWKHAAGLWQPNRLVILRDPWVGADGEVLLLSGVRWMADDQGTRARLTLTRPEAFSLVPVRLNGFWESTIP